MIIEHYFSLLFYFEKEKGFINTGYLTSKKRLCTFFLTKEIELNFQPLSMHCIAKCCKYTNVTNQMHKYAQTNTQICQKLTHKHTVKGEVMHCSNISLYSVGMFRSEVHWHKFLFHPPTSALKLFFSQVQRNNLCLI